MRIVAVSDTHGLFEGWEALPRGDVLVVAGDALDHHASEPETDALEQKRELIELDDRVRGFGFRHVLLVAGNHDWALWYPTGARGALRTMRYLQDEAIILDGVRFYGFPWTPLFGDWAFMHPRRSPELARLVANVPGDADVLISHGPPFGILDASPMTGGRSVGCEALRERVLALPRLKLCVFGHVHGGYGVERVGGRTFANVSICDEDYTPCNAPMVFEVDASA